MSLSVFLKTLQSLFKYCMWTAQTNRLLTHTKIRNKYKKRHWLNWNLYYHYHWFWPKTRDHVFRRCSHMVHVLLNTVAVIFYCSCFDIYIIFLFLCNVHLSSVLFFLLKFAKSDELITWLLSLVHEKFAGKYC